MLRGVVVASRAPCWNELLLHRMELVLVNMAVSRAQRAIPRGHRAPRCRAFNRGGDLQGIVVVSRERARGGRGGQSVDDAFLQFCRAQRQSLFSWVRFRRCDHDSDFGLATGTGVWGWLAFVNASSAPSWSGVCTAGQNNVVLILCSAVMQAKWVFNV